MTLFVLSFLQQKTDMRNWNRMDRDQLFLLCCLILVILSFELLFMYRCLVNVLDFDLYILIFLIDLEDYAEDNNEWFPERFFRLFLPFL